MTKQMIPFNKPFLTGEELNFIEDAVKQGKISGNGKYTKKVHAFFEQKYGFKKCLMTTSCTDALEMAALLIDTQEGDEIIVPSYTFVSSALAFVRQGAKIVFADSEKLTPNIDAEQIEKLITPKTKAIVVVHYAGVAPNMDKIMAIAKKNKIYVIEDAAQGIESYYKGTPLGRIGDLGAFSFHETKNIISGEGGLLTINNEALVERAEIIWEKGTNRASFFRGEIDKYGWVDTGSSFLPSEIISAFLYAQLLNLETIQAKRIKLWKQYYSNLEGLKNEGILRLPNITEGATNNAHMFYILCKSLDERGNLINYLKDNGILAVFHYQSLHRSKFHLERHKEKFLPNSDFYTDHLLRLPMFYDLEVEDVNKITDCIIDFFRR